MTAALHPDAAAAADETSRQFVTFRMDREVFAVPLVEVQEIIRLPDIVEVPLAARHLKGLANLRGVVLPVVSLRRLFGLAEGEADDATRVVVMNAASPIGFIVDRMERVIAAEPREIESVRGIRATVDAELLQGVVKRDDGLVMILNTVRLMDGGGAKSQREGRAGAAAERVEAEEASDEIRLVSFEVERQEYALPIESVEEIVQLPERVNEIPNAPQHLVGIINLRNRMLPLVSLRSLFALPAPPADLISRVVVVSRASDGASVGLVTDSVKEVVRTSKSAVDPLPRMIAAEAGRRNVESICRLDGGKRLVTIMAVEQLFLNEGVGAALDAKEAGETNIMAGSQDLASDGADDEEQFVIFTLADEEYGVAIEAVQEIVRVPEAITRVHKAPDFVEGVINLRGAVMPIVDQRRRFALPQIAQNDRQRIVVFLVNGVRTGFIVDSVTEVLKVSRAQISVAPELAGDREGAVGRVANLVQAKRLILMLDIDRLLSETELASLKRAA